MSTNTSEGAAKERMYKDLLVKATVGDISAFQRLKNLPKQEFDINWSNENGVTFLMAASANGPGDFEHSAMFNCRFGDVAMFNRHLGAWCDLYWC